MKVKLFVITTVLMFVSGCSRCLANPNSTSYGKKFMYLPAREIEFPDFRLKFIGDRDGGSINGLLLAPIFDFEVLTSSESKLIHWSSGTGDIGPTSFKVQKKCFWLELRSSDAYGRLGDNEAVISRRDEPTDCGQDEEAR
jgi:hypothetical protein